MAVSPEDTRQDIRRVAALMRQRSSKFTRALILEADRRIRFRTPVRTGRARGNWNIAIGRADFSTSERTDKSGAEGTARALAVTATPAVARESTYLVNGLPYIDGLEHGTSKQAPAGMVKVTVAELRPLVERIAAKVRAGG